MKIIMRVPVLAFSLCLAPALWVHGAHADQAPAAAAKPAVPMAKPMDPAQIRQQHRAAIVKHATVNLGLDAQTAGRFDKILATHSEQVAPLREENHKLRQQLRALLGPDTRPVPGQPKVAKPAKIDETKAAQMIDQLTANRSKIRKLADDRTKELRQALSTTQYAELFLHWHILQMMARRDMMMGMRGPGGPGGPGGHDGPPHMRHGMGPRGPMGPMMGPEMMDDDL